MYFGGMSIEGIKIRFAYEILKEEWDDFERRHRQSIKQRTTRRTGRLEDDRRYWTSRQGNKSTASFEHPVYERFIDMKKNYFGAWKTKWGTERDKLVRRKGIPIHNRIIFGKLNPLSFRLMHELSDKVREFLKAKYPGGKINHL
jgi:hypothetical protein